jgi:AcrR family transcriptional regulator
LNSRREKKVQLREDQIIAAAVRLTETVGLAGLTMDMIADETAIAKATLYTHFKSKDAIASAIVLRVFNNMAAFIDQLQGDGITQLEAVVNYMLRSQDTQDGFSTVAMRDDFKAIVLEEPAVREVFMRTQAQLIRLIEQAKSEGDIAPELMNEAILSLLFGTRSLLVAAQAFDTPAQHDKILQHGIQIFLRGIRP